ncbi:hypothetical protein O0535_14875 [Brevibacillus halotolerans]|uniref:Uncharacterized protein n=1 Tax=Brevibacillus halotolerans TaxID=1507437 RepID=A0ABT4HZ54_9BACL|nr:hypothetical protein [Brevibacillus halotolerans]
MTNYFNATVFSLYAIHKRGNATYPDCSDIQIGLFEKYGLAKYDKKELTMKPETANEMIDVFL